MTLCSLTEEYGIILPKTLFNGIFLMLFVLVQYCFLLLRILSNANKTKWVSGRVGNNKKILIRMHLAGLLRNR